MDSIKFMIALMAVCALVMPAFSMQDNMGQDCEQKMCSCLKSPMQDNGKMACQGHSEDQKPCGCIKSMMGQDDKQMPCGPKPMMEPEHKQIKSMMGQDCDLKIHKHIKSMMGDRDGNEKVMMIVVIKR